jgi:hypothetical protein
VSILHYLFQIPNRRVELGPIRKQSYLGDGWYLQMKKSILSAMGCIAPNRTISLYWICTETICKASNILFVSTRTSGCSRNVGTSNLAILHRIGEYTKLNLTYPEDILKGISGILNSFQRGRLGIRHYAGIPILPRSPRKTQLKSTEWTPTMGFLLSLLWDIESPSERRTGGDGTEFPSWSWTGWYGPVKWEKAVNWLPSSKIDPDVQLHVELMDGRALKLEEYQDLDTRDSIQSQPSTFIRISAWTVCIYDPRPGPEKNSYVGKIDIEDGGYIEWEFDSISKVPLQLDQVCTGIILGRESDDRRGDEPYLLILNRIGDKLERIGLGTLNFFYAYTEEGIERELGQQDEEGYIVFTKVKLPELVKSWKEVRLG